MTSGKTDQCPPLVIPAPDNWPLERFRLFPVRSPLLGESLLFSLPSGTEMVHFPEFARASDKVSGARITSVGITENLGASQVSASQAALSAYQAPLVIHALVTYHLHVILADWVSPFGHPRIIACLQLPEAFRSWPRPSSPLRAKASTVHP